MNINITKLTGSAKLPERGSEYAAGYDLFADITEEVKIAPHQTLMIGTGLAMEIPVGYFGGVFARSGLSAKEGLRPANCVGVVDSDYRGEVKVALHNDSEVQHESIAPVELMVIVQAACHVQLPVFVQSVVQRAVDERAAQGAVLTAGTAVAIGVVYIDGAPQRERLFHLEPAVGIETEILLSDPRL